MSTGRNTTIRNRHRNQIARTKPDCSWEHCLFPGQPIDYTANHLDDLAFVVDHIIPLNKGGTDTIGNKAAMHRACNRAKSDHLPDDGPTAASIRIFETPRTW